jgi:hypothetical protein
VLHIVTGFDRGNALVDRPALRIFVGEVEYGGRDYHAAHIAETRVPPHYPFK